MSTLQETVEKHIRNVPDFPKPGIQFKDITPLLSQPDVLQAVTDHLAKIYNEMGADIIVGVESRGFIFGTPLALALNKPFVPARKIGKLPAEKIRVEYDLEYGTAILEMHTDAIQPGQKVVIVDDLLATGGTAKATIDLVKQLGGEVISCAFVIELGFLKGRDVLGDINVQSILNY